MPSKEELKTFIKAEYGQAAREAKHDQSSCCGTGAILEPGKLDFVTSSLYGRDQAVDLPIEVLHASLGCGNPTALAPINPGETVLDLGSGGGIDVFLSARRVGPKGKVYGLDMTDEMLELARSNQAKAGVKNVEFLKGDIEHIPLPNASVDLIISNCVINLSPEKDKVFSEAFRVLKPGGRFAVSDIVIRGNMPPEVRLSMNLWAGCVAGALEETEYKTKLKDAGFEDISIDATRIYAAEDARNFLIGAGLNVEAIAPLVDGRFISGFVRATKPMVNPASCGTTSCQ